MEKEKNTILLSDVNGNGLSGNGLSGNGLSGNGNLSNDMFELSDEEFIALSREFSK